MSECKNCGHDYPHDIGTSRYCSCLGCVCAKFEPKESPQESQQCDPSTGHVAPSGGEIGASKSNPDEIIDRALRHSMRDGTISVNEYIVATKATIDKQIAEMPEGDKRAVAEALAILENAIGPFPLK